MQCSVVAAVAANGVIGVDGEIPWHLPEDLTHFRDTTVGHPVIMGRRTFESIVADIGGPLPDRRNVVLTSQPDRLPETVTPATSSDGARAAARSHEAATAYVIGGASVYRQFLPDADELVLTELEDTYDGDTAFPPVQWDRWRVVERECHDAFDIVTYARADEC